MNKMIMTFILFVIYPMTIQANLDDLDEVIGAGGENLALSNGTETGLFDELPIEATEVNSVKRIFWNAASIQQKIKENLPNHHRSHFTPAAGGQGCDIQAVTKTEGSADTCELKDDPEKMAKFIYNFNLSCSFGKYRIAVCSHEEAKLLNELKVTNPEKLVSDDNLFDLDSTM